MLPDPLNGRSEMHSWIWSFPAGLMLIGTVFAASMGIWVQTRPIFAGRSAFVGMWLSLCWWCLFAVLEISVVGVENKAMFARWTWPAIIAMPSCWAIFALRYLYGWQGQIKIKANWLWVLPSIFLIALAVTDPIHHGLYRSYRPLSDAFNAQLSYKPGWVFYSSAFYLYLLMLSVLSITILSLARAARLYRRHYWSFLIASLLPWVANLGYITGYWTLFNFDPTPFLLLITCHIFAYLMWRANLFDLVPVARNLLIDSLIDPILLLDEQNRIIDANKSAFQLLLGHADDGLIGISISRWPLLEQWIKTADGKNLEWQGQYFEFSQTFVPATASVRLFVLHNITARILVELELQKALAVLEEQLNENQQLQLKLREEAIRDSLTGAYNRRFLEEVAQYELAHATRTKQPISLVLIDFDHFKQINDSYGHAGGDAALRAFTMFWQPWQRAGDYCIRYGGEEWLLLLPACSADQAFVLIDQFRQRFAEQKIYLEQSAFQLTFSAGIAAYPQYTAELAVLLAEADKALYAAKRSGRNRVLLAASLQSAASD
jgi:diguanylate cyclase (GGDEF)-like protein